MTGSRKPTQEEVMARLAGRFPALKGAQGIDPWNPEALDEWAASGRRGSGARAVVRFLLAVWNGSEDHWKAGPFRLRDLGELDEENFEVWKAWAARPFFL